jgi:hypothetical protein
LEGLVDVACQLVVGFGHEGSPCSLSRGPSHR